MRNTSRSMDMAMMCMCSMCMMMCAQKIPLHDFIA